MNRHPCICQPSQEASRWSLFSSALGPIQTSQLVTPTLPCILPLKTVVWTLCRPSLKLVLTRMQEPGWVIETVCL
ncbi:unnamed protein product [Dibothriocephalus latus]|uniref:Uncharacterized protein n=1 Tax=Dibothriocephalus latus TaxID=60516 RepID=A0A3P7P093_DIBLA|nr:unnamed protein product [Dibothriocephalus latus]